MTPRAYVYAAFWSEEDEEYVATCDAFPNLTWLAPTRDEALHGLLQRVEDAIIEMEMNGEAPPAPTLTKYLVNEFCENRIDARTIWKHALSAVQTSEDDELAAHVVLLLSEHQAGHRTLDDVRRQLQA